MNLNDYPTPRTNQAQLEPLDLGDIVSGNHARQLEREAAAWRSVATKLCEAMRFADFRMSDEDQVCQALEAFDALRSEVEG